MNHYERTESLEAMESQAANQQRLALEERVRSAEAAKPGGLPGDNPNNRRIDHGIIDVPVRDLPWPEGVNSSADFHKYSEGEIMDGLRKLENMKYSIQNGEGHSSDYWYKFDQQNGRSHENGWQRVYDAFYGDDAILLDKTGDEYRINNGQHRIYLAKQLGYRTVPAHVVEWA